MSAPDVRKSLSPMIDRKVELSGPGYSVDRRRVLGRMRDVRLERQQRPWKRVAFWAAAAVVMLGAGGFLALERGGGSNAALEIVVSEPGKKHARIPVSGELETAEGSKANVRAADGLEIELEAGTRVGLDELQAKSRRLKLLRGAIRCAVPHTSASEPFVVLTPDATIVDLGTVFTVSVEGPDHATHVTVEEGEVMVRHATGESRVRAPGSWSSSENAIAPEPSAAEPAPAPTAPRPAPPLGATASARPSHGDNTLNAEAQLLRQGLAAERQGRFSEARSVLSTLLRKYPSSSLAPDARAALERVQARLQR
jgi:hypothetical protein